MTWLNESLQKEVISLMPGNLVCNVEHDIISCVSAKEIFLVVFFSNYEVIFITVDLIIPKDV